MSFCPTKDIHSVYLDNELPEAYKARYEDHLSKCPECQREFSKLKAVNDFIQEDADSITVDEKFLEDSYERLMIKMSYNKNSEKAKKPVFFRMSYIMSAAAAFIMALFIPIGLSARKNTTVANNPAVTESAFIPMVNLGNNISLNSGKDVVVSGNIRDDVLSSFMRNYSSEKLMDNVKISGMLRPKLAEDNIISIRIAIPNVGQVYTTDNLDLSGLVISGNYEWNLLEN